MRSNKRLRMRPNSQYTVSTQMILPMQKSVKRECDKRILKLFRRTCEVQNAMPN